MKVAYWTNCLSPHQLPLAKEIARRIGEENYSYLYEEQLSVERLELGWDMDVPKWCKMGTEESPELMAADVVLTGGLRPLDLIERRIAAGKLTYYMTERWFKPISVLGLTLPGRWRMYFPKYRKVAKRMVEMLNNPLCKCLAIGPWAKKDMLELGVRAEQIVDWGYFVEPSAGAERVFDENKRLIKVLWVGRMLGWKRVDTIIKAVGSIAKSSEMRFDIELTLVGDGRKRDSLESKVSGLPVKFKGSRPIERIRKIMREHDVYVLASDENEGWGAVVNEALEEGMKVLGTYEAGASAAMLREGDLFHAGDWKRLADLLGRCGLAKLEGRLTGQGIGEWTPAKAAERIMGELC